ncbi:MAG: hypothetical protein ACF8XB_23560 [Planctomycetota bacterium JB042]
MSDVTRMDRRAWVVFAGLLVAAVAWCSLLIVLPPGGLRFLWKFHRLESGMSVAEAESVMEGCSRADDIGFLLGIPAPPDGAIWRCDLGHRGDFNLVMVEFVEGRLAEKRITWD